MLIALNILFLFQSISGISVRNINAGKCSQQYTVVSGDTCYQIALNNGISLTAFENMNPGINCNNLQIGQSVCV